ncbi:unnamed protein product [Triticum turgidum subsp. durum]|uniref:Uncharacterized protein n=1 Tax=Triticum turgidum subsp. durum TaxID=4567 RepID=A0A9R1QY98_TRITD|nr:unnamed protein product [Triticum turgidum subsp. durum]
MASQTQASSHFFNVVSFKLCSRWNLVCDSPTINGQGTPKKPGAIEACVFAMFNENREGLAEIEKHFGLFNPDNPDKSPAHTISF